MIVPPPLSSPLASAASIIDSAMRSLIEAPGLARSDLIQTSAFGAMSRNSRFTRIVGVLPIVSRMFCARIQALSAIDVPHVKLPAWTCRSTTQTFKVPLRVSRALRTVHR